MASMSVKCWLLDQGEQLVQSPTQDYGKYIAALDARTREEERRVFTRPWRERHQESVDAGVPLPTVEDWTNQVDYAVYRLSEGSLRSSGAPVPDEPRNRTRPSGYVSDRPLARRGNAFAKNPSTTISVPGDR